MRNRKDRPGNGAVFLALSGENWYNNKKRFRKKAVAGMVFSSISFLFFFLPALLLCYYILPRRLRVGRNLVLLAFSLFFYAYGGPELLRLMLASIAINYVGGLLVGSGLSRRAEQASMVATVAANLLLLGYFKYGNFVVENAARLGLPVESPGIVLPIGISFFTFQGMSYVLDVYRGEARAERNPLWVALYISLFPQLVAGPIVRYTTVAGEIRERRENLEDAADGGVRFLFGLAKKLLLANRLGLVADIVYSSAMGQMTTAYAWLGAVCYMGQIYFDFSGYSDMAIGLGRMFGFHFLENFNYPYISQSITEFWRRWHISLSSWFRDYVYIPLGGSRVSTAKHIRNLLVVWLLTGLWHGAAWNFVAWGLYYGLLLLGEKYLWGKAVERLPRPVRHIYALLAVLVGWVLFRAEDLDTVLVMLRSLAGFAPGGLGDQWAVYYLMEYRWELLLAIPAALPLKNWCQAWLKGRDSRWSRLVETWAPKGLAVALFSLSFLALLSSTFNPFIYFRF